MEKICGQMRHMMSWEDTCYTCLQKKHYADLKENILSGEVMETSCEDEIVCPWCGEILELEPADDADILYCEGSHDVECYGCGKSFEVQTHASYSYDTERSETE